MPKPPTDWTVLSMLEWATSYFEEKGIDNGRFSIEWLLAELLQVKRLDLYLLFDRPLTQEELEELRPLVKRRASHEPLQYITGETDFYNCRIKVTPDVLIPRPETEELVDYILRSVSRQNSLNCLDIGTGSGCIPISLKKENPHWELSATDISTEALQIARSNADLNDTEVHFVQDSILEPAAFASTDIFDVIISNPPYILPNEKDSLDREVKDYEPELALFCKSTKQIYGAIRSFAELHLKRSGQLFLEIHEHYSEEVLSLFTDENWSAEVVEDFNNKPRFIHATFVKNL